MAETEEKPVLSFKERLALFNQSSEPPVPRPRPSPVHSKTANNPPSNVNGSVVDRSIGNQPVPSTPKLNIENNYDNGQNGINGDGIKRAKAPPPPLPSRRPSTQQLQPQAPSPASLPQRPSSLQRGISRESVASSSSSLSAVSARTAPPPLPSRKGMSPVPPPPPPRSQSQSNGTTNGNEKPPKPQFPHRPASNTSSLSNGCRLSPAPALPPRLPPRTPTRDRQEPAAQQNGNGEARPSTRKLPPPPPSTDAVNKIRQSGFGGLNKGNGDVANAQHPSPNGAPPPVPRDTRPDLSKLEATKPRTHASQPSAAVAPTTTCLKCRDFSGPDGHAAQFPRQSLPTQDLSWLANALTAPFPSPTDKARAIFTWLHHNVEYDVYSLYNNCVKPSTPQSTLATGLAVCEGYAGLFAALAAHAGLETIVVGGHGKGTGYADPAPGSTLPPFNPSGHAWNAVRIDNGHWKLIDACWGAGSVNGGGQPYIKHFKPSHFTETNDEFGVSHYPQNRAHFFRDDARPSISWEEYLFAVPQQPVVYTDAHKHNIDPFSFHPASRQIPIHITPGPLRFQFTLVCPHWTLDRHSKAPPGLFLLLIHGIDGRKDERLPFNHVRGITPGGGGDVWYVDIPDARMLGAPGQKLQIAVLTSFGDREDARGLTVEEYRASVGRVGMAWAGVAQWELV